MSVPDFHVGRDTQRACKPSKASLRLIYGCVAVHDKQKQHRNTIGRRFTKELHRNEAAWDKFWDQHQVMLLTCPVLATNRMQIVKSLSAIHFMLYFTIRARGEDVLVIVERLVYVSV